MIFFTFTCWLYLLIFIFCMHTVTPIKHNTFKIILTTLGIAILSGFLLFYVSGPYSRLLVMGIEILFFKYMFSYSWFRIVYLAFFFEISLAASEWTVGTIATAFNLPILSVDNFFYLFYLISSLLLSFIFDYLFVKLYVLTLNKDYPKYSWIILILPFITYYFAINTSDFFFSFQAPLEVAFIFLGLVISNFIMVFLYYSSIQTIQMKNEIIVLNQKETLLKEKMEIINQNYEQNFSFLHQLLHDCSLLSIYEKQNDKDNLHNLIEKIADGTCKIVNTICTNSSTLNSILSSYLNDIQKYQIDIETWVDCNLSSIEYTDQILLFQSILDFCIDEMKQTQEEKKLINIRVREINSKIAIKVVCTWNGFNQYQLETHIQEKYDPYLKTSAHDKTYTLLILFK